MLTVSVLVYLCPVYVDVQVHTYSYIPCLYSGTGFAEVIKKSKLTEIEVLIVAELRILLGKFCINWGWAVRSSDACSLPFFCLNSDSVLDPWNFYLLRSCTLWQRICNLLNISYQWYRQIFWYLTSISSHRAIKCGDSFDEVSSRASPAALRSKL